LKSNILYFLLTLRLDDIVKKLDHKEEVLKERKQLKEVVKRDKEDQPKKLGKYRFEDPPTAVLLTEQLPKNLRSLPVVSFKRCPNLSDCSKSSKGEIS
jgi:hypothetical protein